MLPFALGVTSNGTHKSSSTRTSIAELSLQANQSTTSIRSSEPELNSLRRQSNSQESWRGRIRRIIDTDPLPPEMIRLPFRARSPLRWKFLDRRRLGRVRVFGHYGVKVNRFSSNSPEQLRGARPRIRKAGPGRSPNYVRPRPPDDNQRTSASTIAAMSARTMAKLRAWFLTGAKSSASDADTAATYGRLGKLAASWVCAKATIWSVPSLERAGYAACACGSPGRNDERYSLSKSAA